MAKISHKNSHSYNFDDDLSFVEYDFPIIEHTLSYNLRKSEKNVVHIEKNPQNCSSIAQNRIFQIFHNKLQFKNII